LHLRSIYFSLALSLRLPSKPCDNLTRLNCLVAEQSEIQKTLFRDNSTLLSQTHRQIAHSPQYTLLVSRITPVFLVFPSTFRTLAIRSSLPHLTLRQHELLEQRLTIRRIFQEPPAHYRISPLPSLLRHRIIGFSSALQRRGSP